MNVDLSEVEALVAALGRERADVARRARQHLAKHGRKVAADARSLVPTRTTKLQSGIDTRWVGPMELSVGTDVFYGHLVHDGTPHVGPRPFLAEAAARNDAMLFSDERGPRL